MNKVSELYQHQYSSCDDTFAKRETEKTVHRYPLYYILNLHVNNLSKKFNKKYRSRILKIPVKAPIKKHFSSSHVYSYL